MYFNFDLSTIVPFEIPNYYRYMGSLTTPKCMEGINWYIAIDPLLKISHNQIKTFQHLKNSS